MSAMILLIVGIVYGRTDLFESRDLRLDRIPHPRLSCEIPGNLSKHTLISCTRTLTVGLDTLPSFGHDLLRLDFRQRLWSAKMRIRRISRIINQSFVGDGDQWNWPVPRLDGKTSGTFPLTFLVAILFQPEDVCGTRRILEFMNDAIVPIFRFPHSRSTKIGSCCLSWLNLSHNLESKSKSITSLIWFIAFPTSNLRIWFSTLSSDSEMCGESFHQNFLLCFCRKPSPQPHEFFSVFNTNSPHPHENFLCIEHPTLS